MGSEICLIDWLIDTKCSNYTSFYKNLKLALRFPRIAAINWPDGMSLHENIRFT